MSDTCYIDSQFDDQHYQIYQNTWLKYFTADQVNAEERSRV